MLRRKVTGRKLFGQNNEEGGIKLPSVGGLSLRRSWMVIVGAEAPDGEKANASEIATYLRRKLNLSLGAFVPITDETPGINFLSNLTNVVVVGGPLANEYAYLLNDYCNPKYKIIEVRPREEGETHRDWVAAGGLIVENIIMDETDYDGGAGRGLMGFGQRRFFDKIVMIGGFAYADTCTIGLAFREGMGAGIYDCTYTEPTAEDPCPPDMSYALSAEPAE